MAFISLSIILTAQNAPTSNADQSNQANEKFVYQLFPTKNYWTFIKLDTRNGKMWQVHFTLERDGVEGEFVLNSVPLVTKEKETTGRFTLYPTENIYNFILLDKIDGNVFQVQWSLEEKYRGVLPIY